MTIARATRAGRARVRARPEAATVDAAALRKLLAETAAYVRLVQLAVRDAAADGIAVGGSGAPDLDGGPVENTLVEDNTVIGSRPRAHSPATARCTDFTHS